MTIGNDIGNRYQLREARFPKDGLPSYGAISIDRTTGTPRRPGPTTLQTELTLIRQSQATNLVSPEVMDTHQRVGEFSI